MHRSTKHSQAVQVWEDDVTLPTYPAGPPDLNPMFLEKRVYQGSSGKVYPNAFTDRVSHCKEDCSYRAVFLENEFIRLMLLPAIGGRIHAGQDKTNNYDFFYRQTVIKPALVGLLGPWISGGVEFNWPQHHRPSTFMPVQYHIERAQDGSCTVWLSEHEPMNRMKGMVGICLRPAKALVEARVRLYNRTPLVQTFLWWANAAVHVHEHYQAFFPPDVRLVADHARRAISSFPIARNLYYGVDYTRGVDLTWYKNIPVPTSYMVTKSKYDFFGGYDHEKRAGVIHVADHHIAPGKKLWTWGSAEFGHAWDGNLTESDGPYIELMAGAYTDNQPDFSFLHPFETKSFSQFWYPIQEIGPVKNANRLAAVNLEAEPGCAQIGVCVTESRADARILLQVGGATVFEQVADLRPGQPFRYQVLSPVIRPGDLTLRVRDASGTELISYGEEQPAESRLTLPASEPPAPRDTNSNDELYLTGLHLEQYRHATRSPEPYWREALERDPLDSRCNNALGLVRLRRGEFSAAEKHFRAATERLAERNPNPYDGEAYYNLGLALGYQARQDEAYDAFHKATWNYAWQSAAYYALATIDCAHGRLPAALEHLDRSLATNAEHLKARGLKSAVLRHLGRNDEAACLVSETLCLDPLDFFAQTEQWLLSGESFVQKSLCAVLQDDPQTCLDLAFDYAEAGLWTDAARLPEAYLACGGQAHPMVRYALGYFAARSGDEPKAREQLQLAAKTSPDYCFPARLEEMLVLEWARKEFPRDAKAPYYLGNLLYDKRRYEDAIRNWEHSVELDPSFSIPWRNLGIAYFNLRRDPVKAQQAYAHAFAANPGDARLLYESDQLEKRLGTAPEERLRRLHAYRSLVEQRDDLTTELVTLYNQTGESQKALELLSRREFSPWEGGEGLVSEQYVWAHFILGRALLEAGGPAKALAHFESARQRPHNLGEGKHQLTLEVHLDYFAGVAAHQLGDIESARAFWNRAAEANCNGSWLTYYKAKSLAKLGDEKTAGSILLGMKRLAKKQLVAEAKVDYFATSLPHLLLFEENLENRKRADCLFMLALAEAGLGNTQQAKKLLLQVLAIDRNHLPAHEELRGLDESRIAKKGAGA